MHAMANSMTAVLAINIAFGLLLRNARIDNNHINNSEAASNASPIKVKKLRVFGSFVNNAGNPKQNIDADNARLANAIYSVETFWFFRYRLYES
jgi:hypothetical protein